jgi:pimeloyl-ACP methyl ester carboxylesterase
MKKLLLIGAAALLVIGAAAPVLRSAEATELGPDARTRAPGSFVTLSRGTVHYEVAGPAEGQPVVLVHGFSVPSYIWDPTFRTLAESGFRVIRFDLYGRGYSDRPRTTYDRALFVGQVAELLDSLRVADPVDVVGLSMGGAVTAGFAAEHPERLRRLVLIAPFNTPVDLGPIALPGVGEYINRVHFTPSLAASQRGDFADPERFPGWEARFREQMRYRGFAHAILSTGRHFVTRDPLPDFRATGALGRPTLLVWGDEDRAIPIDQRARVEAALGASTEFLPVPGAGHLPHYEEPELVGARIAAFLGRP